MTKIKFIIFSAILVPTMHLNLFPYISSQVKGVVRDKETNAVIENAKVFLYDYAKDRPFPISQGKTKSDTKGYFMFPDVRKGTYFIECKKEGYATFSPEYFTQLKNPEGYLNIFSLEEGQIKYFDIKMVRGGKLKVSINKKDDNGVSGYEGIEFSLSAVVKEEQSIRNNYCGVFLTKTDKEGLCIIDGLHPGQIYSIWIQKDEFSEFDKDILIKKDETVEITHLYDFTDKTGISGNVVFSDKHLIYSGILLVNLSKKEIRSDLDITNRSEYIFRNLEAGDYIMYVYVNYENDKKPKKTIPVVVERNKTTIKDLHL